MVKPLKIILSRDGSFLGDYRVGNSRRELPLVRRLATYSTPLR